MTFALVVAGKGGRRSRVARDVAAALAARGLRVGGFTQRTLEAEGGAKTVELVRVRDGRVLSLARTSGATAGSGPNACALVFDPAAFAEARLWLEADAPGADVLVLDGLGKLELGGEGHRASLVHALAAAPLVVLAVRDDQLVYAIEGLGLGEPLAAYTDGEGAAALDAFIDALARAAARRA